MFNKAWKYKLFVMMRLTLFVVLISVFQGFSVSLYGQNKSLNLKMENATLKKVLNQIENETDYFFMYNGKLVNVDQKVSVNIENKDINNALKNVFKNTDINFEINNRQILLFSRNDASSVSISSLQQKTITGKITDSNNQPLPGVTVVIKGTTTGTVTDIDGNYSLVNVPSDAVLDFSFVGMIPKEIVVGNKTTINVSMIVNSIGIDEVVAVGYGIQKKVNLTGSITAVDGENLAQRNTIQTSQALQGMAAGVTVTQTNGRPGQEGTTIRIRGIGTMNDNNPLVLIDGVASSIDAIDPNDIESMSVLKDAASAAIYGSRAANGVILITTKRGKTDKVSVTYKGSVGVTTPLDIPDNLDAWDFMSLYNEANANDLRKDSGEAGGDVYSADLIDTWKKATDRDAYPNSDEFSETYNNQAVETQHYIGFSLGNDKIKTNTSINYAKQNAHYAHSYYNRYGIRSNNTYTVNKVFEFGFDLSSRNTYSQDAALGGHPANGTIDQLMRQPAIYATRYSNGVWGGNYNGDLNERQILQEGMAIKKQEWQETLAKLSLSIKPFSGMQIDFSYAPKFSNYNSKQVNKSSDMYDYLTGDLLKTQPWVPDITQTKTQTREDDNNVLVSYTKSLGKHDVAVLGGFQYLTNSYNYMYAYRQVNEFQQFEEIDSFSPTGEKCSGYTNEWALMSYFGRLNYAFDNKYLFEANVRYDGSSKFANGYKWGLFPSFSGAWRFSSEPFMQDLDWLNQGKVRVSWGELGNQSGLGSNYPFAQSVATNQYTVFGGTLNPGYAPVNYALTDITWESTRMTDFGIDLTMLNGKLDGTFDWYKKQTNDILLTMPIPGVMGYSNSPKQNVGGVENKGWDLSLSHKNTIGKLFYKVTAILSDVKNKVTDMGGLLPQISGNHVTEVGEPINSLYGYVSDGLFNSFTEARAYPVTQFGKLQGGDIRYVDQSTVDTDNDGISDTGDNLINTDDKVVLGNIIPRYTYSLDMYAAYKGFDFALFFQGVAKRDGYMSGWSAYPFQNASTALVQHLDRWSEANPNPDAAYPRLSINQQSNNLQSSSFWKLNAAYLRCKNVQIGYTIPSFLLKSKGISSVRFYANGTNLFTISDLPIGMDPESPENIQNSYPLLRTYTFGVEVKF